MAIAASFPNLRPSLLLDFANAKAIDPRVTFTRSTTAKYYDGVTTAKAEENLLTYSQEFEVGPDTNWENGANACSVTANSASAPDGTSTADTIAQTAITSTFILQQRKTILANTNYTISTFVKNVDINYVAIALSGATNNAAYAEFDLTAGTLNRSGANGTGWAVLSTAIQNVGNSWYRISAVITAGSTVSTPRQRFMLTDGTTAFSTSGTVSFTGTNLSAYFWGAQLEQRSAVTAYTPTTTQPITNYIPVLQTAAAGVPRIDHNPVTGECLGLLIEEQRTNLLTYSEDFGNVIWNKSSNCTVTPNDATSPDGTTTADRIVISAANTISGPYNIVGTVSGLHTQSWYVKQAATVRYVQLLWTSSGVSSDYANFDLQTGTLTAGTYSGANIQNVGNGWYRISLTSTLAAVSGGCWITAINTSTALRGASYPGTGAESFFAWGVQVEAGAFPTSYIPTVATQETRNADAASMTGTNFSSWYNAGEGTLYAEALKNSNMTPSLTVLYDINAGANVPLAFNAYGETSTTLRSRTFYSANQAQYDFTIVLGSLFKLAYAAQTDSFAASFNGSTATTDTSGSLPPGMTRFDIGYTSRSPVLTYWNGHIRKISYYPKRLTNANLQALTA